MKTPLSRLIKLITASLVIAFAASCTTTYDAYGRPRQTVDPGLAIAGVAAAGLIGYALANDNDSNRKRNHRSRRNHRSYNNYGHSGYHGGHGYRDSSCY